MNTTTPPTLSPEQAAALLLHPDAMAILDLRTHTVALTTETPPGIWESPRLLVLATHDDAEMAASQAASSRDLLAGLTAVLNEQIATLHEDGEIPTEAMVIEVLAEMAVFDAEVIDLASRRAL